MTLLVAAVVCVVQFAGGAAGSGLTPRTAASPCIPHNCRIERFSAMLTATQQLRWSWSARITQDCIRQVWSGQGSQAVSFRSRAFSVQVVKYRWNRHPYVRPATTLSPGDVVRSSTMPGTETICEPPGTRSVGHGPRDCRGRPQYSLVRTSMDYYGDGFRINVGNAFADAAIQNCEQFGEGDDPTGLGVDTLWRRGGVRGGVPGGKGGLDLFRAPGRLSDRRLLDCSIKTVSGRGQRRIAKDGSQGSPGAEVQESFSFSGEISWTLKLTRRGCGKR